MVNKPYYQDNWVTIYYGDCMDILPQLPDKSVDLVFTDPPFGITKAEWDKIPPKECFDNIFRISKNQLFFGGQFFDLPKKEGWLIWSKKQDWMDKPFSRGSVNEAELLWISKPIKTKVIEYHKCGNIEGFKYEELKPNYQRPKNVFTSQKPERLVSYIIMTFFADCATVLDPFMGSGTTLAVCKKLNRHCIGIEIKEERCEIAANRCRQMVMDLGL